MIRRLSLLEQKPGWMLVLSLTLHLLLFFICTTVVNFRPKLREATPYYVDLVSLPSLEPSPAMQETAPQSQMPATAPQAVIPAPRPAMKLPVKTGSKPAQTPAAAAPTETGQEAREFAERLSKLAHNSEAKHQAAALEALKRKVAVSSGALSGTGSNTGSDYGAYIQSRLRDALANTIVYRTRQPETAVHLYIDRRGKLLRSVMVTPSKDKLFNDSVIRAIDKAKLNFPPPPNGADFDKLFVFSPQEVLEK